MSDLFNFDKNSDEESDDNEEFEGELSGYSSDSESNPQQRKPKGQITDSIRLPSLAQGDEDEDDAIIREMQKRLGMSDVDDMDGLTDGSIEGIQTPSSPL